MYILDVSSVCQQINDMTEQEQKGLLSALIAILESVQTIRQKISIRAFKFFKYTYLASMGQES